jgi:hypothetical protein
MTVAAPPRTVARVDDGRRLTAIVDIAFCANLLVAIVLGLAHAPSTARLPFVLLALLTCPGYPLLRLAGLGAGVDAVALTVALSLALTTLIATVEAITRWWHPEVTGLVIGCAGLAALGLAWRSRPAAVRLLRPLDAEAGDDGTDEPQAPAALRNALTAVLVVCLVLWLVGTHHVNLARLGPWGLLPRLPVAWYVGVALVVAGALMAQRLAGRAHAVVSAGFLAALVLYLYATAPAIESTIRYVWTYKHLSVVQGVIAAHGVHRTDIYQRWPGLFATTAMFATLTGHLDPTAYVRWGEPLFAGLDLVMLYPLARRFTSSRGAWIACYFFTATNWVGQQYFSPQAFAYVLTLTALLLATALLVGSMSLRPQRALASRLAIPTDLPARVRAAIAGAQPTAATWRVVIPALAVIDAAIVVSHQLTPYILLFDLGALVVVGLLSPWWAFGILVVLTAGFLAPNLAFIQRNFGLLSSLDPFRNALTAPSGTAVRSGTVRHQADLSIGFTALIWLTGLIGMAVRARRRDVRRSVLTVALLFVAPFLTVLVQSYGGEARFRVLLFSLPACSIGAAWLWERSRRRGTVQRALASLALLPIPVALFIPNFFDKEDIYYIPTGETAAANWIAAHKDGEPVAVVNTEFPGLQTDGGVSAAGASGVINLIGSPVFTTDLHTGLTLVQSIVETARQSAPLGRVNSYVIFATTEANYARDFGSYDGPTGYLSIERAVASSTGQFTKVFANSDATIYQIK